MHSVLNPRKIKLLLLGWGLTLLSLPVFACDAELLSALRTRYTLKQDLTLEKAVQDLACSSSSSDKGTDIAFGYGNFGLEIGQRAQSVAEACIKRDSKYFAQNKTQIGLSFVPGKAIDGCFGGLSFTATESPGASVITVSAAYLPREGKRFPKVESFDWQPRASLDCRVKWKGKELIPGGSSFTCSKLKNVDIALTLNTDFGGRHVVIRKRPKVERHPMAWDYVINLKKDHNFKCKNQFGELVDDNDHNDNDGWYNCDREGVCNNGVATLALCRTKHGSEYYIIDGIRVRSR